MAEQKKYWIKLEKDFLNSSQIKVIKNMQNGKDYIIFYLALMLESTNTEGHLRFNELVPYNEEMLASVTDTNVDIVRSAIKIFESLGLIQFLENGTIFLPDVPKRVGKESESAERVRLYRERTKMLQCNDNVTNCNDNKDKDKNKDKNKKKDKDKKETYDTILESEKEEEVKECLLDFIKMRKTIKRPLTNRALKMLINKLNNLASNKENKIKILEQSILNCWQDIYELKNKGVNNGRSKQDDGQSYDGDLFKTN